MKEKDAKVQPVLQGSTTSFVVRKEPESEPAPMDEQQLHRELDRLKDDRDRLQRRLEGVVPPEGLRPRYPAESVHDWAARWVEEAVAHLAIYRDSEKMDRAAREQMAETHRRLRELEQQSTQRQEENDALRALIRALTADQDPVDVLLRAVRSGVSQWTDDVARWANKAAPPGPGSSPRPAAAPAIDTQGIEDLRGRLEEMQRNISGGVGSFLGKLNRTSQADCGCPVQNDGDMVVKVHRADCPNRTPGTLGGPAQTGR